MNVDLDFMAGYYIADCAAQVIQAHRPGQQWSSRKASMILREPGVQALRYLWKNGDSHLRRTVAARLHVSLHGKDERGFAAGDRQTSRKPGRALR